MPTNIEKDHITGAETTGHEWDGIRELNNPLPKWWLYTFYASVLFALIWSVLYPSVPGFRSYFGGVLNYSQRSEEHPSELQSLMRISYAVFCLKKNTTLSITSSQSVTRLTQQIN